ncbi:7-cyano-7-deazaguanine synthase [Solidesulfovibrio carbinolicus]|uniref:Glutamine amidotransferase type-2 domain-containing protein n=1 Tax=Solidesulfovibrio carbinolicus TaxID=296842 RepID=A0A4P6HRS6_9BACT|nr:7-cyano-7-deazaguanine synthase [Solidesulfovibrio carbinolicus]QAZ69576.1 hypothetical protein C3Y92_20010 [Solidesulfovibrio carbinolicus]
MCGIFGFVARPDSTLGQEQARKALQTLVRLSERRGREASGLAARLDDRIWLHKAPLTASRLLTRPEVTTFLDAAIPEAFPQAQGSLRAIIGHARLTTNGFQGIRGNNQPVAAGGVVGIHNGIIVNVDTLWRAHPELTRHTDVDTELFMALLGDRLGKGESLADALSGVYGEIEGSASVALLFEDRDALALASNTGSLHVCLADDRRLAFFASEGPFLDGLLAEKAIADALGGHTVRQVAAGQALALDLASLEPTWFGLDRDSRTGPEIHVRSRPVALFDTIEAEEEARRSLPRCTRCILPETMPYIEFDEQGVCNYCHGYKPIERLGRPALERVVRGFKPGATADCVVAFSGGRDSSYCLHYAVKELGLRCIAYTYDWGMVNDLARRNQARVTGKLGVEHIIISADIKRKRRNIRMNVEAWLRKPDLGLIPLFMAGDKQFFYWANVLKKETGIENSIWAENQLERTHFKVGFCRIASGNCKKRIYKMSAADRMRLAAYYSKNFLKNPAYLNSSILDTITSYISYYVIPHDYTWFYDYVGWEENSVNDILFNQYDWELDPESTTTWRIGDGTAAFYNFIYYTVAGFTENDTFRSNQIREGQITRERALALAAEENRPRYQGIMNYCQLIGVDFDMALSAINAMPKLYPLSRERTA